MWRDIVKIGEELEGIGIDFTSSFRGVVGDGKDIGFWVDRWVDDSRLCDRFNRLFHLDRRKEERVAGKGRWVNNEWQWEWDWGRCLSGRVCREFDNFLGVLQNVVISNDCRDQWRWMLQESGDFTVKALTRLVEEKLLRVENGNQETLWNNWLPKKVNIFVWRALKGRLPVREELDKRALI